MSKLDHSKHIDLIESELTYQTNEFKKLLKKQAAKMFISQQLYICRFQGYDETRGNILVKFDHKVCLPPRKNEVLLCFITSLQDDNVNNWGGKKYEELRTDVKTQFEAKTVFFKYTEAETIVGVSGIEEESVKHFKRDDLVFLAPNDPPLQYLMNLHSFLKTTSPTNEALLDINISENMWRPKPLIVGENIVSKIQLDLIQNDTVIIQGPPGTGKTYLMAKLCEAFLRANNRILVTALTNRALIELAEKEFLESALETGRIYKSALTAEEKKRKKLKGIKAFKSLSRQKPDMLLATYFVMSQIATIATDGDHFDYIIIEESSQAFLSTLALARKLGKKCIIIGDIMQLEPIFHKEFPINDKENYHYMVNGLKCISYYLPNVKQYILTNSYRLNQRSVIATNSFYNGKLKSKSDLKLPLDIENNEFLNNILNPNGGPVLKLFDLDKSRFSTNDSDLFINKIIREVVKWNSKLDISVLAFNRDTIRSLQKSIFSTFQGENNITVDTIDRIQGLTTDICIFFIPLDAFPFALQNNRFNVATSRAKIATIIIADTSILNFVNKSSNEIKDYFKKLI